MTPEQEERFRQEAHQHPRYDDGNPKMHRHVFSWIVHRDDECDLGVRENGQWTTSRRRVYVFDDDYLDEHERIISERVYSEGFGHGVDYSRGATEDASNPYEEEE